MEPSRIVKYLEENYSIRPAQIDSLQFLLSEHLYYFGDHFKNPREFSGKRNKHSLKKYLKYLYTIYRISRKTSTTDRKIILSSSYFSVNSELKQLGYQVSCPIWEMTPDRDVLTTMKLFLAYEKISNQFIDLSFRELFSERFSDDIVLFEEKLRDFYIEEMISGLFVPSDVPFFSNLSIKVCRQLGIPSFIFLHGLPQAMDNTRYDRSDYLIVWGEKIKEYYVNGGMNPSKILVSGHPSYKNFIPRELKFDLENIIILTKSVSGTDFGDRANSILYLYSIQKVLKELGVTAVTLRPHPGENSTWYSKFIDTRFYHINNNKSIRAIKDASLIIGPTSSVLLEAIYNGVNFVVYEPIVDNVDFNGRLLLPPFDGSDFRVPVAHTEDELEHLIKNKIGIDSDFFSDYCQTPFDLSIVKQLV